MLLCCYVVMLLCCYVVIYIPIRGNPTKLAPIPNPAPERADTPIAGTYVSKTEKVAAAAGTAKQLKATQSSLEQQKELLTSQFKNKKKKKVTGLKR